MNEVFKIPKETPPIERFLSAAECDPFTKSLIEEGGLTAQEAWAIKWISSYALHWVFKNKWCSRHKIPGWQRICNESRQGIKAYGNYYLAILEICLQCSFTDNKYKNTGERFVRILWEIKEDWVQEIFDNEISKTRIVEIHKKRLGMLEKLDKNLNPYTSETSPHRWRFVDDVINMANESDKFRRDYFKPFIRAYSNLIKDWHTNSAWICTFRQDDKLAYHPARGRGVKYLYSPLAKTLTG